MTCVAKESLLKKKALKEDRPDENLLDRDNINWPAMHEMCREYSGFLSGMPRTRSSMLFEVIVCVVTAAFFFLLF